MGGLCSCCPRLEEVEDMASFAGGGHFQPCHCLRCCLRWCIRLYAILFAQSEGREPSLSALQGAASSPTAGLLTPPAETAIPDSFRAPPRPLPYDVDARYLRAREGLSRRDKSGSTAHHSSETDALRGRSGEAGEAMAPLPLPLQRRGPSGREDSEGAEWPESPQLRSKGAGMAKVDSLKSLSDDDCCPTCLEGYSEENPKITTDCGHHFHLSCIYEWMERSKHCPVCDKIMVFSETL